jgi:hypothetical protein
MVNCPSGSFVDHLNDLPWENQSSFFLADLRVC